MGKQKGSHGDGSAVDDLAGGPAVEHDAGRFGSDVAGEARSERQAATHLG